MSINNEISRLNSAKQQISSKMQAFGISSSTAKLDELAEDISSIPNQGSIQATLLSDYDEYQIPEGYHDGTGSVRGSSFNPTAIDDIILVQSTEPASTKTHNKVWIDTDPTSEYVVPTIDEFNALAARVAELERVVQNL